MDDAIITYGGSQTNRQPVPASVPPPRPPMTDPPADAFDWHPPVMAARERCERAMNGRGAAEPITPRARTCINRAFAPLLAGHPEAPRIAPLVNLARIAGDEWADDHAVVVPIVVPIMFEREPGAREEWLRTRAELVLACDAVALLLSPTGPIAELERRHAIILRENEEINRRLRLAAEQAAHEAARRARWDLISPLAAAALRGAAKFGPNTPEGQTFRALFMLETTPLSSTADAHLPAELDAMLTAATVDKLDPHQRIALNRQTPGKASSNE